MIASIESRLKRIAVDYTQVLEHHQPPRSLLILLVRKLAVTEIKQLVFLAQKVGHYLDQVVVFVLVYHVLVGHTAIHKHVALA